MLDYRLCASKCPQDEATILLLFEHLTRPYVSLEKEVWPTTEESEGIDVELSTEGSEYWLNHAWLNLLQPNLEALSDKLLLIVTSHIQHAYSVLRSFGKDRPTWDPLSSSQGQIESTGQGSPRDNGIGLLINIARDVLRWNIAHRPARADFFVDMWFSSGYRLLRRLAIFGVAEMSHWNPDKKMNWLLENKLLHTYGFKPEVFAVLQKSYAHASESARIEILGRALKGSDSLEGRTKEYEIFNLLYWLSKAAPDCPHTKTRFDEFANEHPDFGLREHPDLDRWMTSGWEGSQSPLSVDEILAKTPEELLQFLTSFKPDDNLGPGREGLIHGVSDAVTRQYAWGIGLVCALKEKQFWEPDLWKAIISGWSHSDLTEEQWSEVLTILLETSQITSAITYEASHLLESGIAKTSHAMPGSFSALAVLVGEKLWRACEASDQQRRDLAGDWPGDSEAVIKDWLQVAINDPAGTLLTFRLRILSRLREEAGEEWSGIPEQHKQFFATVLAGDSNAAELGRVLIASQLYFLFILDQEWTVRNVIPLFKFSESSRRAIQAWDGYLVWGKWAEGLLPHLMPCFEEAFPQLQSAFPKEQRERFCEYLAGIACHSSINPIQDGWLNKFLVSVTAEERARWASSMSIVLKGMKEPAIESAWNIWIKIYWQNRIEGVPVPLEPDEVGRMVYWSTCFKTSFPEVTAKVYESPTPKIEHPFLHHDLSESDLPGRHPEAVGKFVLYLLRNGLVPAYDLDPIVKIVHQLKPFAVARNDLLHICEELAALGYPGAGGLRDSILGSNQS